MTPPLFGFTLMALCLAACGRTSMTGALDSPAQQDTAYAIQGEYLGVNTVTGDSEGAQVMALGQDNFGLLLLNGGLPGRGWDGKNWEVFSGTLQGNSVHFTQNGFNLSVQSTGDSVLGTTSASQSLRLVKILRQSPSLGQTPPSGATVLFDGSSVSAWNSAILDSTHALRVDSTTDGAFTKQSFGDFVLHVEFYLPFEPDNSGQDRANSGVYLQDRYELQILDSFGESLANLAASDTTQPAQQCGAIYGQVAPLTNASFPPLMWQTYDIGFTAAKWDSLGNKTQDASVTVLQNGIVIQQNRILTGSTLEGNAETSSPGPIFLQYHQHTVLFRNIWITTQSGGTPILPASNKQGSLQGSIRLKKAASLSRYALVLPGASGFVTPEGRLLKIFRFSN